MEFTEEIRDKIIETARDVRYICEELDTGKKMFREHGERIRELEHNQQLLTGKVTVMLMFLGACVLFITNLIARLWR